MTTVTHDDVVRVFPGIQDHTVVELLEIGVTVDQLETARLLLADQDEGLIDREHREGGQLSRVLEILSRAEILPQDDRN